MRKGKREVDDNENRKKKRWGYWTKERVLAQAEKYKTRANWKKNCAGSYSEAYRSGWMKEAQDKYLTPINHFYRKEEVLQEALKYQRRVDFMNKSPYHYSKAQKSKWIDECCAHMMSRHDSSHLGSVNFKWTKEKLLEESSKFNKWADLRTKNKPLYTALCKHGLKNEVKATMVSGKYRKWSKDTIIEEAKKYQNACSWRKGNSGSYQAAKLRGWFDEVIKYLPVQDKPFSKEEVIEEAKKYIYLSEFRKLSTKHYQRAIRKSWLKDCCNILIRNIKISNSIVWTKELILEEIKKYSGFSYIIRKVNLMKAIEKFGILEEVKLRMDYRPIVNYTKEEIVLEASKYDSRKKFFKNAPRHYAKAKKEGILDELFKPPFRWNKKLVLEEAKKYQSKSDFYNESYGAYKYALKNGVLSECCSHMVSNKPLRRKVEQPKRWTKEEIFRKAREINSWTEICTKYQGLVGAMRRQGLTEEVKEMFNTRVTKYSYEELKTEALKYTNKQQFRRERESMMRTIYDRKLSKELFAHMTAPNRDEFLEVERKLLHPKIKEIFNVNNQTFLYEKKHKLGESYIIPDFLYNKDNILYIVEAKTSYRRYRQYQIDRQIEEQKYTIAKENPGLEVVHILLSEEGIINSSLAKYNMSLAEFKFFIETGNYKKDIQKNDIIPKDLALRIEEEFREKFINKN